MYMLSNQAQISAGCVSNTGTRCSPTAERGGMMRP